MQFSLENFKYLDKYSYLGVSLTHWTILLSLTIILGIALRFARARIVKRLKSRVLLSETKWDDVALTILSKTNGIFIFLSALVLCANILMIGGSANTLIHRLFIVAAFFQTALWGNELVAFGLRSYLRRRQGPDGGQTEIHLSSYSAVSITAKFLLWVILFLLLLDNLGVNITALITGLGIGGIAIALAVQNILGDIFSSLSIVMDKPFEVGDFIVVDGKSGTVESIGLKTSRIKSLSGEQLVFPNRKLVDSYIQNFKRMHTRRIAFSFGVAYETPIAKLESIPQMVKDIVATLENATIDRVHLSKFGDSSLDYEVVYIMQVPEFNTYMDAQESINLQLLKTFAAEGIEFAYPTRTLFVKTQGADLAKS